MTKTQVEVITSERRRRHWSRADKESSVAAAMQPGATILSVARALRAVQRLNELGFPLSGPIVSGSLYEALASVWLSRSLSRDRLVDVFFLSRVHTYQCFDCLDHSLRISNKIAVDVLRRQIGYNPVK